MFIHNINISRFIFTFTTSEVYCDVYTISTINKAILHTTEHYQTKYELHSFERHDSTQHWVVCGMKKRSKHVTRPLRPNESDEGHSQTQPRSNMSPRQQEYVYLQDQVRGRYSALRNSLPESLKYNLDKWICVSKGLSC